MIKMGNYNELKIVRKADFGYYLDAGTGKTSEDVLLPNGNALGRELSIGDEVRAFIYRDSKDRPIATLKEPLAEVGVIAHLEVVSMTKIGSFVNIGLERDVLVPYREENFKLEKGKKYLFCLYLDKTGRIAATTKIDDYLLENDKYNIGDEVTGVAYGFQTNGSVMVAVDNLYRGVILKNEYFTHINAGEELSLRVKKIYEDNKLGLTPRSAAVVERHLLEDKIMDYLRKHDGFMEYNDKSSPQEIKEVFNESKNYFKNALGGLMRQRLIEQDEKGTRLIKK